MTKLIQKRIALFGGLILLAAVGCYLLWNRVLNWDSESQQQTAASPSSQAHGSEIPSTPGFGDAVGWLDDWQNSIRKNEPSSVSGSPLEAAQSLRNNPKGNEPFYQRALQILMDPSINDDKKRELIFTLDRTATPAAFQFLAELSQMNLSATLKEAVLRAIANTGNYYWDKQSLAQVIPALRQLWLQSEDPEILRSAAAAMAKVGDSMSINALMDAVLSNSKSIADIENSNDARISAAWSALKGLSNPEVVLTLQQRMQLNASSIETSVSANLLAIMGNVGNNEARQALLSWAQGAGDHYAPVAHDAFSKFGTLDSQQYIKTALAQNPAFKSNIVKSAIQSTLQP